MDIMSRVNEVTPAKEARVSQELAAVTGGVAPSYLNIRTISPLDLTAGFESELAAYKMAYAYREHWQSEVRIERQNRVLDSGLFLVVMTPKAEQ